MQMLWFWFYWFWFWDVCLSIVEVDGILFVALAALKNMYSAFDINVSVKSFTQNFNQRNSAYEDCEVCGLSKVTVAPLYFWREMLLLNSFNVLTTTNKSPFTFILWWIDPFILKCERTHSSFALNIFLMYIRLYKGLILVFFWGGGGVWSIQLLC